MSQELKGDTEDLKPQRCLWLELHSDSCVVIWSVGSGETDLFESGIKRFRYGLRGWQRWCHSFCLKQFFCYILLIRSMCVTSATSVKAWNILQGFELHYIFWYMHALNNFKVGLFFFCFFFALFVCLSKCGRLGNEHIWDVLGVYVFVCMSVCVYVCLWGGGEACTCVHPMWKSEENWKSILAFFYVGSRSQLS